MQVGPYRILGEIARGGMGVVYRAEDAAGQAVALKVLLDQRARDPRARSRFQREVEALARLRHPNVVTILGAGKQDGHPWMALEYVEGESLEARLRRGRLPVGEAVGIAQQLARALSYVHGCGVLHRDLKPDNVLLRGERALLTDFGLVLDAQSSISRMTATGVFQGTPGYWAPEQAQGRTDAIGVGTDVYGLGAVLYACLTGHAPVRAASLQEYLESVAFKRIAPPRKLAPETPPWLNELCMRCLRSVPERRPSSADDVARALLLGMTSPASPAQAGRGRVFVGLGLGAAAVLASGGLVAVALDLGREPRVGPPRVATPSSENDDPPAPAAVEVASSADAEEGSPATGEEALEAPEASDVPPWGDPRHISREAQAHLTSGNAHLRAQRYDDAIADYDRALAVKPNFADAFQNRGLAKNSLRRFEEAITDFDAAIALFPQEAPPYILRGEARRNLGRFAEAIVDYDRALELSPNSMEGYAYRGLARASLGQMEAAIADYDRALTLTPPGSGAMIQAWRDEAAAALVARSTKE